MTTVSSVPSSALAIFSPLNYLIFLTCCLAIYLAYLILPRGCRARYCGTGRRRYRRQLRHHASREAAWEQSSTVSSCYLDTASGSIPPRLGAMPCPDHYWGDQSHDDCNESTTEPYIIPGFRDRSLDLNGSSNWYSSLVYEESKNRVVGAFHSNDNPNKNNLLLQMKQRLSQCPGIKMIAHGTKCNPRPVWITLHFDANDSTQQNLAASIPLEYQHCLTWRAEIKRQSNSLDASTLKLGNLRKVAFQDILGIQRGKCTTALRRVQTAQMVNENECFSLLTKSGTVDLQCMADFGDAAEVREVFIMLLGMAVRSKGLTAFGLTGGAASVNKETHGNGNIQSAKTNAGAGKLGFSAISSAPQSSNRKSDYASATNEYSDSSQLSGPMSSVTADANLSIVSF